MTNLRLIVACSACSRQFDGSGRQPGEYLRCLCGERIEIPQPRPQQAAVVRCSSCGGPRQDGATACGFCGGDFTLHELDLDTLCPRCMSRISRDAHFCHSCAQPILVTETKEQVTDHPCPVCEGERTLNSREIGGSGVSALECPRCAGLWLGADAFRLLAAKAKTEQLTTSGHGAPPPVPIGGWEGQGGPVYRSCPICGDLMNRQNYGRRSGIILDVCQQDGVWFDHRELEQVLDWLQRGGAQVTAQVEAEDRRAREQKKRAEKLSEPLHHGGHYLDRPYESASALERVLEIGWEVLRGLRGPSWFVD